MNKKLRILFCMLLSIIAICAIAFIGCDDDTEISSSPVSSSSSSDTGSDGTSSGDSTHTHTYSTNPDDIEWTWTEDTTNGGYIVKASLPCTDSTCDYSLEVTATVTCEVTTPATCTTTGLANYTAKATINGTAYTATKTGVTLAKDTTNHSNELSKVDAVASTDDTDGNIEYYYCQDCENYYSDSEGKTLITAADTVITHKASVVPTSLTIGGATEATLNSTNDKYDLYYDVTTSGYYTIVLTCDDLASIELSGLGVSVYNGNTLVGSLTDAENYTILTDYAEGETLDVYAVLNGAKLYPVTFTVTITYKEGEVERVKTGYAETDPIWIYYGTGYNYNEDMPVVAGDTLWYEISGRAGGIDLKLSVSSTDTTFTVYGGSSAGSYSELTPENGYYTFTLNSGKQYEYIKIVVDNLTSESGTIRVALAEDIVYIEETSYSIASYATKNLVAGNNGYYTFTVDEYGEVCLTVTNSKETYIDSDGNQYTYAYGRYFGSDEEVYTVTVYIDADTSVSIYAWSASTVAVTYSETNPNGDNNKTLTIGQIVNLTQGSGDSDTYTMTLTSGTYRLEMYTTDELTAAVFARNYCDASVKIGDTTYDYEGENIKAAESYTYIEFTIDGDSTVTVTLAAVGSCSYYAVIVDRSLAFELDNSIELTSENANAVEYYDVYGTGFDTFKGTMYIMEVSDTTAGEYTLTWTASEENNVWSGAHVAIYYYSETIDSEYIVWNNGYLIYVTGSQYDNYFNSTEFEFKAGIYFVLVYDSASAYDVKGTLAFTAPASGEDGGNTSTKATVNISSLVSAETLSATTYTEDITLYSGDDGTKVVATATSEKSISVDGNNKSIDGYSFTYRLKLSNTATSTNGSLKITTVGACTILVYMMSSSSSTSRTVNLYDSSFAAISGQSKTVNGIAISVYAYTVSGAGTYYIGSTNSGLNVYGVVIDYDCSELTVADSVTITGATNEKITLAAGEATTLTATATVTDGEYTGSYIWVSSDSDAVSLSSDSNSVEVTAKEVTEDTNVTITVSTSEGVTSTFTITVTATEAAE